MVQTLAESLGSGILYMTEAWEEARGDHGMVVTLTFLGCGHAKRLCWARNRKRLDVIRSAV